MAIAALGFDGTSPPKMVPALGSFVPACLFSATVSGTTTSEAVTFPNLVTIKGAIIQVLDSGNNSVTTDIDVTWSGNILTLADGSTFNLDAASQVIYGVVWGTARA